MINLQHNYLTQSVSAIPLYNSHVFICGQKGFEIEMNYEEDGELPFQ